MKETLNWWIAASSEGTYLYIAEQSDITPSVGGVPRRDSDARLVVAKSP
jgi:hypothetical protein